MILPSKIVPLEKSLLYKSIEYYKENKDILPRNKQEIIYILVLYAIDYIEYEEVNGNDIRIYKIK